MWNVLLPYLPGTAGHLASRFCPMNHETESEESPYQPPGWVFGVVWPVLYSLLGKELAAEPGDLRLWSLVALLTAWIPTYSAFCRDDKANARRVLAGSLALALTISRDKPRIAPVAAWLAYAMFLSLTKRGTARRRA